MCKKIKSSADVYYNDAEARKYTTSSRIQTVQAQMTRRALALLDLRSPSFILDVGCGSGLSGSILSAAPPAAGGPHTWVGMDISSAMLSTALERGRTIGGGRHRHRYRRRSGLGNDYNEAEMDRNDDDDDDDNEDGGDDDEEDVGVDGDLLLADMGQGVPFRPGTFDAAISISALQWLCNAETSADDAAGTTAAAPHARLARFFAGLFAALRRGARAVCQFYPRNAAQRDMVCAAAVRAGFGAGLLEDDPGTKSAKLYLVLTVGGGGGGGGDVAGPGSGGSGGGVSDITGVVSHLDGVDIVDNRKKRRKTGTGGLHDASNGNGRLPRQGQARRAGAGAGGPAPAVGSRQWILRKKEQMERRGKVVKMTSKYTGRKRRPKF
jgi:18S rRNA (guanine1575-N7)-methyltransferase